MSSANSNRLHGPESMPSTGMDHNAIPTCLRSSNLEKIAKALGKDGKSLGRHLGFSEGELHHFEADNKNNLKGEIVAMLTEYIYPKAREDQVEGLLAALEEIGRMDIYAMLENAAAEDGDMK